MAWEGVVRAGLHVCSPGDEDVSQIYNYVYESDTTITET